MMPPKMLAVLAVLAVPWRPTPPRPARLDCSLSAGPDATRHSTYLLSWRSGLFVPSAAPGLSCIVARTASLSAPANRERGFVVSDVTVGQ